MFYAGALPQMYSDAAVCIEKILRGRLLARADEAFGEGLPPTPAKENHAKTPNPKKAA